MSLYEEAWESFRDSFAGELYSECHSTLAILKRMDKHLEEARHKAILLQEQWAKEVEEGHG